MALPNQNMSMRFRRSPLADPAAQISSSTEVELRSQPFGGDFDAAVRGVEPDGLRAGEIEIFQINLGKLCNMTCRHCHVDAGPDRGSEVMDRATVEACLRALDRTRAHTVDLTGGAPELNPHFRKLVEECSSRELHVIDRCNLTVLLLPRSADLPEFLARHRVEVVCSLPHFRRRNTDAQRGEGTFERSIEALRRLNAAGYGSGHPDRILTLMVNPVGAILSGCQSSMERDWRRGLASTTASLSTVWSRSTTCRSRDFSSGSSRAGISRDIWSCSCVPSTPRTAARALMCRNTLSVSWDGRVFDCDFNQMLDLECRSDRGAATVADLEPSRLRGRPIVVRRHCFGCTAGSGSSCGGALHSTED